MERAKGLVSLSIADLEPEDEVAVFCHHYNRVASLRVQRVMYHRLGIMAKRTDGDGAYPVHFYRVTTLLGLPWAVRVMVEASQAAGLLANTQRNHCACRLVATALRGGAPKKKREF